MKFSIRDLLFVTMITGLFFAWSMDHRNMEAENQRDADEHKEDARELLDAKAVLQGDNERLKEEKELLRREVVKRDYAELGAVGLYWP